MLITQWPRPLLRLQEEYEGQSIHDFQGSVILEQIFDNCLCHRRRGLQRRKSQRCACSHGQPEPEIDISTNSTSLALLSKVLSRCATLILPILLSPPRSCAHASDYCSLGWRRGEALDQARHELPQGALEARYYCPPEQHKSTNKAWSPCSCDMSGHIWMLCPACFLPSLASLWFP